MALLSIYWSLAGVLRSIFTGEGHDQKDKHIEHHIKQMKILREDMVRHNDNRKIYGALAGAIFGTKEKAIAIDAGFFVLEQSGGTMKISVPEGFTPKEW